jgi:hypothetical protein
LTRRGTTGPPFAAKAAGLPRLFQIRGVGVQRRCRLRAALLSSGVPECALSVVRGSCHFPRPASLPCAPAGWPDATATSPLPPDKVSAWARHARQTLPRAADAYPQRDPSPQPLGHRGISGQQRKGHAPGTRTGRPYTTPLAYFSDGPGRVVLWASRTPCGRTPGLSPSRLRRSHAPSDV